MSAVYNLRSHKLDDFIVTKFDDDFNIESYYEMTVDNGVVRCGCPAGARPKCRHREMFPELLTRLDTAWFLDFDTRSWVDPTGEAKGAEMPTGLQDELILAGFHQPELVEEMRAAEPITRQPDSHPFRRRL